MYEELDKKIVDAVKAGHSQFYKLEAHLGLSDFRKLDRRLQALRKRGTLKFDRKTGWSAVNP